MKLTYLKPKSNEEIDRMLSMSIDDLVRLWDSCSYESREFIRDRLKKNTSKKAYSADMKEIIQIWSASSDAKKQIIMSMLGKNYSQMNSLVLFIKTFPKFSSDRKIKYAR